VGAALLSVSALNTLRSHTLVGVDFRQPAEVLSALNQAFPMENHNNLFFSLWYGVYCLSSRELHFASGGHPPALLLTPEPRGNYETHSLRTEAPAIGCFEEARYVSLIHPIVAGARLLVFSDGVFEVFQGANKVGTWEEFLTSFELPEVQRLSPGARLERAQKARGAETLEDDFSLLEVRFP